MRIYTREERLALMTEDRRALHRIPEYGYDLFKTRAYLYERLKELTPDVLESCDEGIKVVFRAENPVKGAIALRADMDALKLQEKTEHDFPSEHPGMMHACGHDGHMAAMLMAARIIAGRKSELSRDAVIIFQPAEENLGGAKRMIDAGAMVNPTVAEVYGMHIMPSLPIGTVGCCEGAMMAAVDTIEVEIHGRAAHGATPHLGNDAIMAMAHFVLNAQAAMERRIGPMEPAVFTVGSVESGKVYNIISEHAMIKGNLRSYSPDVSRRSLKVLSDALASADVLYNTSGTLSVIQSYPPVINDADCVRRVMECAGNGYQTIEPVTISEDFSEFELCAPGAYFFCGCADEKHKELLHSDRFDFDESALLTGVEIFEKLVFGGAR